MKYYRIIPRIIANGLRTNTKLRSGKMKKIIAIIMVLSMLFAFASCKDGSEDHVNTPEVVTDEQGEAVTDESGENVTVMVDSSDETTDGTNQIDEETTVTDDTTSDVSATVSAADPSSWTKEEVVAFYRNAAIKSTGAKSVQTMTLSKIVVNDGDGFIGTVVEWATPIIESLLAKNSTEFDGITGGYKDLVPSDAASAKAYKSGKYTVVEMTMVEQTDGVHGDTYSGTVGHAISVVGDVGVNVGNAIADYFEVDFDNAVLELHYSKPTLKVKINEKGIIEKGTWSYTVDVTISNLRAKAVDFPIEVTIKNAFGSVDYKITTGGGF